MEDTKTYRQYAADCRRIAATMKRKDVQSALADMDQSALNIR